MSKLPKFTRRQVLVAVALYVVAVVALGRIRFPENIDMEIAFYIVLLCLTGLFFFATGTYLEVEE